MKFMYDLFIAGSLPTSPTPKLWEDVNRQRAKGAYPFTHLAHKQSEEVWIDPTRLPMDITA